MLMQSIYTPMPLASLGSAALGFAMFILSIFLILLVLVQRGKGGGLTGALGGPGGQSAFGSKAGDTFTVITAVSAIVWGLVCAVAMYSLGVPPITATDTEFEFDEEPAALTSPLDDLPATGAGGLSNLDDLLSDDLKLPGDDDATAEETPSAELTPAGESDDAPAETTEDPAGSEPEGSETGDGEAADGGSDESPAENSGADAPASE